MIASVILAHPYTKSFNHAIFSTICSKLESLQVSVYKHDLYAEKFNPIITADELGSDISIDPLVIRYTKELMDSNIIFFVHPNWWGQPPAILKGYIDRVIRPPHAYDFPEGKSGGLSIGKLKNKFGVVFNTANTEESREKNYFHDPLDFIWKQCVFGFCGIENYYRKMFTIVADSDETTRKQWLKEVETTVNQIWDKVPFIKSI